MVPVALPRCSNALVMPSISSADSGAILADARIAASVASTLPKELESPELAAAKIVGSPPAGCVSAFNVRIRVTKSSRSSSLTTPRFLSALI